MISFSSARYTEPPYPLGIPLQLSDGCTLKQQICHNYGLPAGAQATAERIHLDYLQLMGSADTSTNGRRKRQPTVWIGSISTHHRSKFPFLRTQRILRILWNCRLLHIDHAVQDAMIPGILILELRRSAVLAARDCFANEEVHNEIACRYRRLLPRYNVWT